MIINSNSQDAIQPDDSAQVTKPRRTGPATIFARTSGLDKRGLAEIERIFPYMRAIRSRINQRLPVPPGRGKFRIPPRQLIRILQQLDVEHLELFVRQLDRELFPQGQTACWYYRRLIAMARECAADGAAAQQPDYLARGAA